MDLEICVRGGVERQLAFPSEGEAPNLETSIYFDRDYLP